jgi:uncharacterized caspase-like protein
MTDRALLVGINRYPGQPLNGCINDVDDMAAYLINERGFGPGAIAYLKDGQATTANIVAGLKSLVAGLRAGDRAVFHYSGHGTQMPTYSGTEVDGLDEVICPVDFDWTDAHALRDKQFHKILKGVPAGVEFMWISDSCHSGDLQRAQLGPLTRLDRYLIPPPAIREQISAARLRGIGVSRLPKAATDLNVALLAGCRSNQTSADASISGRWSGAFTYFLLASLRARKKGSLKSRMRSAVLQLHKAQYDQTPQLAAPVDLAGRPFATT